MLLACLVAGRHAYSEDGTHGAARNDHPGWLSRLMALVFGRKRPA